MHEGSSERGSARTDSNCDFMRHYPFVQVLVRYKLNRGANKANMTSTVIRIAPGIPFLFIIRADSHVSVEERRALSVHLTHSRAAPRQEA
jgi:hypothetical protein